jgi:hypothetical protein
MRSHQKSSMLVSTHTAAQAGSCTRSSRVQSGPDDQTQDFKRNYLLPQKLTRTECDSTDSFTIPLPLPLPPPL